MFPTRKSRATDIQTSKLWKGRSGEVIDNQWAESDWNGPNTEMKKNAIKNVRPGFDQSAAFWNWGKWEKQKAKNGWKNGGVKTIFFQNPCLRVFLH